MDKLASALCLSPGITLETLCGKILGPSMKKFILLVLSGSQICAFIGSFILATDLLHHSFCGNEFSHLECVSRFDIGLFLAAFNILMVFIPNLKTFGYISSLSVVFQFFALLCVFFSAISTLFSKEDTKSLLLEETLFTNWSNSPETLGIILYIFQRITFYLPIKANYSQVPNFHKYYVKSMNYTFFYILLISSPCYFLFFTSGKEIVFQNFDKSFRTIEVFKLCYIVVIFLSNPINLFPIYNSIYSIKGFDSYVKSKGDFKAYLLKLLIRLIVSCFGILIGITVNSFVKFCSFVGAFFFSFLGLILPGVLLLKFLSAEPATLEFIGDSSQKNFISRKTSVVFVVAIGCVIWVSATCNSIRDLIFSDSSAI